jgi:hypothetical protein
MITNVVSREVILHDFDAGRIRRLACQASFLVTLLLLTGVATAASHYVLPSPGAGTNNGSDWTNACSAFTGSCAPDSLVRGDTYYVGGGSYSALTFRTPESGTSLITIKGATAADHGTATGWSSSYGVDVKPASLGYPLLIYNGYVTFDGNMGSGRTGSSYGFTIGTTTCSTVHDVSIGPGGVSMSSVTLKHFYFNGCVADTETIAITVQGTTTLSNSIYSYSYFHNWQVALQESASNTIFDHNSLDGAQSYGDHHGNQVDLINAEENITISNSMFLSCAGTVCVGANDSGSTCSKGMSGAIYGDVFVTGSTVGNGIVGATTRCYIHDTVVYNNTFTGTTSSLPWFQGCVAAAATCSSATGNIVENNIVWNAACAVQSGSGAATHDYNSYLSCIDTAPTETHGQIANLNPFINAGTNNYALTNTPGSDCSSATETCLGVYLGSPYNVDPNGMSRTNPPGRGAYPYGVANLPQPPTGLTGQVQ